MQRHAAAGYLALFLVISAGSYGVTVISTPPDIKIEPDHELRTDESVTLAGTQYTVTALDPVAPSATLEWAADNQTATTTVSEGTNVTLADATYTAHFEDRRLQLTSDQSEYMAELRDVRDYKSLMHRLSVIATLSGITALVLGATAFMPVRGD